MSGDRANRSADAALTGFQYQLDKSLVEILESTSANAVFTLEGVEDIDISDGLNYVAIQCKYLHSQTRTPSKLRRPISLMLSAFKGDPLRPWKFRLFAHFGSTISSLPPLTVETLKTILTYRVGSGTEREIKHADRELDLSDQQLTDFLSKFEYEEGPEFKAQHARLLIAIERALNVSSAEASEFFYGKALTIALDIATRPAAPERSLTRVDLLKELRNAASSVASPWLINLLGKERAFSFIEKACKRSRLFSPSKRKTLVLDGSTGELGAVSMSLAGFIGELIDSSYKIGKHLYTARPWTVFIDVDESSIKEVKRELLKMGITFNDGYEHVRFSPRVFAADPVINRQMGPRDRPTEKLGAASYSCRLASLENAINHLDAIPLGNCLVCVGSVDRQRAICKHCEVSVNIGNHWTRAQLLNLVAL
jgi:hypothetical protein